MGDWCHCHSFDPVNWTTVEDLSSWFHNLIGALSGAHAKGARSMAILTIWTLWGERNRRIFDDQLKPTSRVLDEIKEAARMWNSAGSKHLAALVDLPISE